MPFPLLCLPFAGGGASFFKPWKDIAPPGMTVLPVELPGHEKRFIEEPYRDVHAAADGLLPEVTARIGTADSIVLFGHSMGAVLAYELARRLGGRAAHVFVSGSPGPWTGRDDRATGLTDSQFLDRVREFAGYRPEAFDDPEILELLLPVLRADVAMHEDYKPLSDLPLDVPITAIRGSADDLVSMEQAAQWQRATTASFELVELAGGHMYLLESAAAVLGLIGSSHAAGSGE